MRTRRRGSTRGIIDVGTNSIHLLIGDVDRRGRFRMRVHEHALTRLGEGGLVSGQLTRPAMTRAINVLRRYAKTLQRYAVGGVDAVATSAVREARNGGAFMRRVRAEVGLPLRVLSGGEEARLIYLGVVSFHHLRGATMVISIGGGSTQIIVGDGSMIRVARSLPLGSTRLAQRFIRHDPARPEEIEALARAVRRAFSPVARVIRQYRWQRVLGCSAMIEQVIMAASVRASQRRVKSTSPLTGSRHSLHQFVEWLSASTVSQRKRVPGLDPKRQDLALTTAVSLLTWMEQCGVSIIRYATGSLREGLVMDETRCAYGVNKEHRR